MGEGRVTNQLRTLRFLAGEMTQAELGAKIGVTRQTIAAILGKRLDEVFQWESGKAPPP